MGIRAGLVSIWVALLSPIGVFSGLFFFHAHDPAPDPGAGHRPAYPAGRPPIADALGAAEGLRVKVGSLFAPGNPLGGPVNVLTHPLTTVSLYVIVMAVWHVPPLYDAAQGRTLVHDLEHFCFMASAILFWWPVIHPAGGHRRLSFAAGIPYFLPPMLEGNLIGALLVFANRPLYAAYRDLPSIWGISALQDQQLAGLIMWVPGGLFFIMPIFTLLTLMFRKRAAGPTMVERDYKHRAERTAVSRVRLVAIAVAMVLGYAGDPGIDPWPMAGPSGFPTSRAGPYILTVFTSPTPIRVGSWTSAPWFRTRAARRLCGTRSVQVTAEPVGHEGSRSSYEATHELATNKLYFAANVDLPEEGRWRITVQVAGDDGDGNASFEVDASQGSLLDTPLLLGLAGRCHPHCCSSGGSSGAAARPRG